MRIRSIKPEFWTSYPIAALPEPTALLFIGLWNYVQDNGVGRDDALLIKAALYALREEITSVDVARRLGDLEQVGLIHRYAKDGVSLLYVVGWDEHQIVRKASTCKYERPSAALVPQKSALVPKSSAAEQGAGSREMEQGAGSREQVIEAAGAARPEDKPMARVMAAIRTHLYHPDGKPPVDWNDGRDASIAKVMLDRGTPVNELVDAIEGIRIAVDRDELAGWTPPAKRGDKLTLRILYHTKSGVLPTWTLALNALGSVAHQKAPKGKRGPMPLSDILGTIRGAA